MSFTRFAPTDFVVSTDSITAPAWSSNQPVLTSFYTGSPVISTTINAGAFYTDVYQLPVTTNGAAVQFSIAYGHQGGSGSLWYNTLVPGMSPSKTTYQQYKQLVYGPEITPSQSFNFGGAVPTADLGIFALNIDRNRYKGSLLPGTFNISLSGSNGTVHLTDNSNDVSTVTYLDCGRVFDIISGSYGHAIDSINSPVGAIAPGYTQYGSYGLFLPDVGAIILNANALNLASAFGGINLQVDDANYGSAGYTPHPSASYTSTNNKLLYQAVSASGNFQLNSQEAISSDYVFVRINNAEYNYSSNPTYTSGSGNLLHSTMVYSPQTYITTVGMYNDNNELLAVAKMSKPLVKDFTKEALIRVKLDW